MLAHGQKIEMIGKVTGVEKEKVLMEDCTFREVEKVTLPVVTAKNLVAAYTRDWQKANATYGSWNKSKQMILTGVIQEIKSSDQIPKTTLFLEPRGKFTIEVGVNSSEATGIRSVRTAVPARLENRVCSTFESGRYCRSTRSRGTGAIDQYPPRSRSNRAAKMEGLSNRGQQSQSMEPPLDTRAAARQSPIMP